SSLPAATSQSRCRPAQTARIGSVGENATSASPPPSPRGAGSVTPVSTFHTRTTAAPDASVPPAAISPSSWEKGTEPSALAPVDGVLGSSRLPRFQSLTSAPPPAARTPPLRENATQVVSGRGPGKRPALSSRRVSQIRTL